MSEPRIDVIIIGAGMAGLAAAGELRRQGVEYLVLEAQGQPGGRAASIHTPTGLPVDLGAQWLHGKYNPMKTMLKQHHIVYDEDKADHIRIYQNGHIREESLEEWMDKAINHKMARRLKKGELPDTTVPELAVNEEARHALAAFAGMWNGLDPPLQPSALEFLTDENTPGGLQFPTGMGEVLDVLVEDANSECIRLNTPVSAIISHRDDVEVRASGKGRWHARKVIFTGSLGVIQSGRIMFEPSLSIDLQHDLARIAMGKMNKIIVELDPQFFAERKIPKNFSLELLDANPPHFCQVRSAGHPIISLFVSGPKAREIEHLSEDEAILYMKNILAPVEELAGFEAHITGSPIVTHWVSNPYILGAYSACLPGGKRSDPRMEGNICFCGDTFDKKYPASIAGAYRSGKAAALIIAGFLHA